MEFHFGKFGTPDHCGKDTRKYLYVMGGLAVFILLATYVYEYHYLAGKQARQDVAAVNQTQGQAVQFASAPSSLGMNVMTPINSTATMAGAPLAPAQRVVFQNNPSMMMPVDNPPPRPQFNSVVQGLRGSIVSITASQSRVINRPVAQGNGGPRFAEPMIGSNSESIGSGVVVSNNGYIVTNYHVVKNSTGLMVTLFGKRGSENFRADMVKQDPSLDLALLKIQPNDPTQPAPLGDSSQLQVADSVIAIGSPFGLDLTVSRGIVSGMRRAIVIDGVTHDQMIQTDAAINQGNSGGAMINRDGEVIGINTAIYTPTGAFAGIGFAIPVNKVKGFIQDQVSLTDMAPGQGNSMQMLDPLPIRRQTMSGTQMQNVAAPQGPPIRANAMPPANHSDGRDRMACATCHQIQPTGANRPANGQAQAMLQQAPMAQPVATQNPQFYFEGAVLEPVNDLLVNRINAQVNDGAFISTVYPDTAAEQSGLQAGDIIFKINGRWVLTPDELLQRVADYTVGDSLRLGVYRGKERLNLNLTLSGQMQQTGQAVPEQNPQMPVMAKELRWIGMELKPITPELVAKKPELMGKQGSHVGDVDRLSLAEQFGLQKGDVIRRINGVPVNEIAELERAINSASLSQGVLLLLERNGRAIYLTVKQ